MKHLLNSHLTSNNRSIDFIFIILIILKIIKKRNRK
jgi:hypothetical protein